jgi:OPA family sugar phosphate sensor protein UhpC-like MFS transporter
MKWEVFLSITLGYSFFYVCRLSLSVAKKPMLDSGAFDAGQLGLIGSALFFTYAVGKLVNGILADRVNVKRFMIAGLFVCSLANLILGFGATFWLFFVLWGLQGWFQSTGAPSSVVSLAHWFTPRERGTYYSLWSTSHNIGEAVTFIATAVVVGAFGWQWGFRVAGAAGLVMCALLAIFMHDRPGSTGSRNTGIPPMSPSGSRNTGIPPASLPNHGQAAHVTHPALPPPASPAHPAPPTPPARPAAPTIASMQWAVFKNPAIWCLALASALMYVTRYAVNSWGIFYLQAAKNYTAVNASSIVALGAIFGIAGTVASGFVSDLVFRGQRGAPAFLCALVLVAGLALFLFTPASPVTDGIAIALWGFAIGGLLVFLGGLMAGDLAGKQAAGTALGLVGIASYLGAALQDIISGRFIESGRTIAADGAATYDFHHVRWLWLGAAILCALTTATVWFSSRKKQNT